MFCLLLVFGAKAQESTGTDLGKLSETEIPSDPDVKIGKLKNGLTYYIKNNGKPEDKVELRLVVNAGSIMETDRQLGLAHFMEHMNFNGTKNFEKNDLVAYLQSIGVKFGADLNAYTSFDETVYILPIPSDDPEKLEKGFQILEDWAHNTTLSEEGIDGERGVVLEELRLRLGAQDRMQKVTLPKIMYGSKYAERLPIGTKENLENFTYKDVRDYYNTWYRPDLMAVIAVGDLDVATLEKKIKTHFSNITGPKNPQPRETYELPNHEETLIAIASDKEAPFSRVQVMYKDKHLAPVSKSLLDFRDGLIRNLFSTMINNRLSELRNSPNPPFVYGYSYYGNTFARSKKAYQSFAQTSPEGQLKGLKAILEENERVRRHGFQEGEFERAKKSLMAGLEKQYNDRDKQESNRLVGGYINHYLRENPMPGIAWQFETVKKLLPEVKLDEVSALIKNFLHEDNRVIVLTGPEKEGLQQVSEAQVNQLLQQIESAEIAPYKDDAIRNELIENLPPAGRIVSTDEDPILGTTTLKLSNGATLTYKKTDFKNDEVLFEGYSPGGSSLYADETIPKVAFANRGLAEAGIGGLSVNDLRKVNSGKIVRVGPGIGANSETFRGMAAPKDLETLFQMVHLYFTDLNKDPEAFASYLTKQKGFLGNLMANPQFYFSDQISKIRNEGNPRYVGFPTLEGLEASDYDLAFAKYQERFGDPGDFHYFLVGNIAPDQVSEYAVKYLASLPGKNSNENFRVHDFRAKDTYQKHIVHRGKDPKSQVRLSWQEEIPYDRNTELAINGLGEVLTIKLIEKLREEEGGVYGVGARGSLSKIPFSQLNFGISFPCGPENVDKLTAAALAEIEKIKKDGVSVADMGKIKETYLIKRKEDLKTNNFWMRHLVGSHQNGADPKNLHAYESEINGLTSDNIQSVAKKYLDENYFLAILLPETSN